MQETNTKKIKTREAFILSFKVFSQNIVTKNTTKNNIKIKKVILDPKENKTKLERVNRPKQKPFIVRDLELKNL